MYSLEMSFQYALESCPHLRIHLTVIGKYYCIVIYKPYYSISMSIYFTDIPRQDYQFSTKMHFQQS